MRVVQHDEYGNETVIAEGTLADCLRFVQARTAAKVDHAISRLEDQFPQDVPDT